MIDACVEAWDKDHVGIRISPMGTFNSVEMGYDEEETLWLVDQIQQRGIAFYTFQSQTGLVAYL